MKNISESISNYSFFSLQLINIVLLEYIKLSSILFIIILILRFDFSLTLTNICCSLTNPFFIAISFYFFLFFLILLLYIFLHFKPFNLTTFTFFMISVWLLSYITTYFGKYHRIYQFFKLKSPKHLFTSNRFNRFFNFSKIILESKKLKFSLLFIITLHLRAFWFKKKPSFNIIIFMYTNICFKLNHTIFKNENYYLIFRFIKYTGLQLPTK